MDTFLVSFKYTNNVLHYILVNGYFFTVVVNIRVALCHMYSWYLLYVIYKLIAPSGIQQSICIFCMEAVKEASTGKPSYTVCVFDFWLPWLHSIIFKNGVTVISNKQTNKQLCPFPLCLIVLQCGRQTTEGWGEKLWKRADHRSTSPP